MSKKKVTSVEAECRELNAKDFRFFGKVPNTFPKSVKVAETVVSSPTNEVYAIAYLPDTDARENVESAKALTDILTHTEEGNELVASMGSVENALRYLALTCLATYARNAVSRDMTSAPALTTLVRKAIRKDSTVADKIADFLKTL